MATPHRVAPPQGAEVPPQRSGSAEVIHLDPRRTGGDFSSQRGSVNLGASVLTANLVVLEGEERIARARVPWHYYAPADSSDLRTPWVVNILEGLGAVEEAYEPLARALASRGVAAITHQQPRTQEGLAEYHPKHLLHPVRLASQAGWAAMRGVSNDESVRALHGDISKFVLFGHSWGGDKARHIAKQHPDRVGAVVFGGSTGTHRHHTHDFVERAGRFSTNELRSVLSHPGRISDDPPRLARREAYHNLRRPGLTGREALAASNAYVVTDAEQVLAEGIDVRIMLWENDSLAPAQRTIAHLAGRFGDRVRVIPGLGHLAPQEEPEIVADDTLDMLSDILPATAKVSA